jgi:hypothetical protein
VVRNDATMPLEEYEFYGERPLTVDDRDSNKKKRGRNP